MSMKKFFTFGKGVQNIETKSNSNPYSDDNFFSGMFSGLKKAGVNVSYSAAMRHQDVYSCIRIKSESAGQLPIRLYRRDSAGAKTEITSGREHTIFTQRPNAYQTWQEFIETYITAIEVTGNFYAEIKRNRFGNVYEITPFKHQFNCSVEMDNNGRVYYTYVTNEGTGGRTIKTYQPVDILHIKQNSLDGYRGLSPVRQSAQVIGSAIAGETHAAALFENGTRPSGVLSTEEAFGEDDDHIINRLRKQWNELYQGSHNAGKTAVLEYGLKFQQIQMTAVDAQLLEQRKFSREQIAAIFRVPLHLLQAGTGMKYSNVEQNNISFFRDSILPLVTKLENNINPILPANHVIKLDEKEFVRGDRKAQVDNIKAELTAGLISVAEGREGLGYKYEEGTDVFAVSTNNLTFGKWTELPSIAEQMNPTQTDTQSEKPQSEGDNNEPA